MTKYGSGISSTVGTLNLGVRAGSFPIRLMRVEIVSAGGSGVTYTVTRYSASTLSAGSSITPFPLRSDAPASSATSRSGLPTGTATVLKTSTVGAGFIELTYEPPGSLIVPPGSAIGVNNAFGYMILIYYDEIRLQGGF